MGRKGQSITLSLSERDKAELNKIALECGKTWGDRANISKLIEAIARRELEIVASRPWPPVLINILDLARQLFVQKGQLPEAEAIARLLQERRELPNPLRREIERFLNQPQPNWQQRLQECIDRQQPFRLVYQDASDRLWQYTILYARMQRSHLMCRCEETRGDRDIPQLQHNWMLRLDRMQEAAIAPIQRPWESDLAQVIVELHFYGRYAFTYEPHPEDTEIGELQGDPPYRRILRRVYNSAQLFENITPYWDGCVIVSPQEIRDRFLNKLATLSRLYRT